VILEAFDEAKVPEAASVFKDPSTAAIRVYANDAAKEAIERLSSDAGLSGIEVVPVEPL